MKNVFWLRLLPLALLAGCATESATPQPTDNVSADIVRETVESAGAPLIDPILVAAFANSRKASRDILELPPQHGRKEVSRKSITNNPTHMLEYIDKDEDVTNWTEMFTNIVVPKALIRGGLISLYDVFVRNYASACTTLTNRTIRDKLSYEIPHRIGFLQCLTKESARRTTPMLVLRHEVMAIKIVEGSEAYYVLQSAWHTDEPNSDLPLLEDSSVANKPMYDRLIAEVDEPKFCVLRKISSGVHVTCLNGDKISTDTVR